METFNNLLFVMAIVMMMAAILFFGGEPDISDALRHYIDRLAPIVNCEKK